MISYVPGRQSGLYRVKYPVAFGMTADILLMMEHIDDSADDRVLVRKAIALSRTPFEYHEADGMQSAVAYFKFGV
jgi:hypothetical protein